MELQVELVRHVSAQQPVLAASKVAERLQLTFSSSTFESVSSKVWLKVNQFSTEVCNWICKAILVISKII
jgi:hypothetical protein